MGGLPDLLTIEEAAQVLRVGRTKAYAMAREWRATGGRSGLPVVDFGHALRVPLCQLEKIIGGPLSAEGLGAHAPAPTVGAESTQTAGTPMSNEPGSNRPAPPEPLVSGPDPERTPEPAPSRPSRRRTHGPDQPTLPFAS